VVPHHPVSGADRCEGLTGEVRPEEQVRTGFPISGVTSAVRSPGTKRLPCADHRGGWVRRRGPRVQVAEDEDRAP
jgi:hypothetical protein